MRRDYDITPVYTRDVYDCGIVFSIMDDAPGVAFICVAAFQFHGYYRADFHAKPIDLSKL